jgi:hypothetical protein
MLANTFSHGLIRDYVISFGTLFNNIKINRRASSGESASTIAVPLLYAPQQRYIARINDDLNLDKPVAITLPRMSFEMTGMTYASERKLNTVHKLYKTKTTANTQLYSSYAPVPYDFSFQLSIYTTNIEDGTHIIEQILPYFTPEFTVTLKSVSNLELNLDLPVILTSVASEDTYEGGFDDRRLVTWTLDFTLKGNLLGYVKDVGIINKAYINFHSTTNTLAANSYDQTIINPAMFANGMPITTATNAILSVEPDQIPANSNFGISTNIINFLGD